MSSGYLLVLLLSPMLCYSASPQDLATNFPDENFHLVDVENLNPIIKVESLLDIVIDKYYNSTELNELFDKMSSDYGHIMKVTKLGKSPRDQEEIRAIQISSNVQQERELLKPMFRFVANIHGDDAVGYALMVTLVQYLVYNYGVNTRITDMLNTIDIWIVPTLNPDGLRNAQVGWCESSETFADRYDPQKTDLSQARRNLSPLAYRAFENKTKLNIQRLFEMYNFKTEFVLSGNIKAGAIVASHPVVGNNGFPERLARTYARQNPMMEPGDACDQSFPDGITSALLFEEKRAGFRGLQNNQFNCLDFTLYLGCCRYPKPKYLPFYWAANFEAMLTLIESTRIGVFGLVTDVTGKPIKSAEVSVQGMGSRIKVTDKGEYWCPLLPGTYKITASRKHGVGIYTFEEKTQTVTVTAEKPYVQLDFALKFEATIEGYVKNTKDLAIRFGFIIVQSLNKKIETDHETGYYKLTLGVDEDDIYITACAIAYKCVSKAVNMKNLRLKTTEPTSKTTFYLEKKQSYMKK